MRVCLIHLPLRVDPRNIASGIATPPLWAALLQGALGASGHGVTVIDGAGLGLAQQFACGGGFYRGLTPREILEKVPPDTQVIGLSCMFSSSWPLARQVLNLLGQGFPGALLVTGGEHPSALPERVLQETPAHAVVKGEGEAAFLELLSRCNEATDRAQTGFSGVAGLTWKTPAGKICTEPPRPRLKNLDDLPPPDWRDIPVKTYMAQKSGVGANRGPFMPILATRGCPHECTFCASPAMWTTRYVMRSPASVVDEMHRYHAAFGATDFHFADLTAIVSRQWTLALCEEITRRAAGFTWQLPSGTRSEVINQEVAAALSRAGLKNLAFALESGDAAVLKRSKKRTDTKRQLVAARALMQHGVRVGAFFVVGFPYDTPCSLMKTLGLIGRCAAAGFSEINLSTFVPVPGSQDFNDLLTQGSFTVNDAYYDNLFHWLSLGRQTSYNPRLGHGLLRAYVLAAYGLFFGLSFLLRPRRLWAELRALLTGAPDQGKLAKVLRSRRILKQLRTVPVEVS